MSNFQTEALDCKLCADEMLFKTRLCCSLLKDDFFVSGSWHNIYKIRDKISIKKLLKISVNVKAFVNEQTENFI